MLLAALAATLGASGAAADLRMNPDTGWYQTDGTVRVIVRAGGVVYVGGAFGNVRPDGAAPGTNQTPRSDLAAFDAATGKLLPWNPNPNGQVRTLAVSPDGSRIYAGGDFTTVGGSSHLHLVALPAANSPAANLGAPLGWPAYTDGAVRALLAVGSRVYVGGDFHHVNGAARKFLAAVGPSSGTLVSWAAQPDAYVGAFALAPSGRRIFVGGAFQHIGTSSQHALAVLDPITGAPIAWGFRPGYAVLGLATDSHSLYMAGSGQGGHVVAYSLTTGKLLWQDSADGDVTGVSVYHDQLIVTGHFRHVDALVAEHLASVSTVDGTVDTSSWTPSLNQVLGGYAVLGYGDRVYAGGDFTKVDNQPQQALAQFDDSVSDTTPPAISSGPAAVLAAGTTLGTSGAPVTLRWAATDDFAGVCSYQVSQQTGSGAWTPVALAFATAVSAPRTLTFDHAYHFSVAASDCADNQSAPVSAPGTEVGIFQNSSPSISYSGSWVRNAAASGSSGGTVTYTDHRSAAMTLHFASVRQIAWVASRSPVRGTAYVYLDGGRTRAATINLHSTTIHRRQIVFTHSWPTPGAHTIRIVCAGTAGHPRIDVDALLRMP
jgi:hypothetical protein